MSESKVKMTRELSPPESDGVHFRILCMTGKNKGVAYFLKSHRVVMGRGSQVDIQILDEKSSREHGEFVKSDNSYILTDLKSSNGILVNNKKIIQKKLLDGDTIVVGKVVFKFNIYTRKGKNHLVKNEDYNEEENERDVEGNNKKQASKNKFFIYAMLLLVSAWVLLDEGGDKRKSSNSRSIDSDSNNNLTDVAEEYIDRQKRERHSINNEYIHRGQREFREGNYFRAMDEFNMALILNPNDGDAGFYLNKTKQAFNNHIKFMFKKGGREYDQLKYSGAVKSYCEIVKLLYRYPNDERYQNAKDQVEIIGKKMGIEEEEYRCWEEELSEN